MIDRSKEVRSNSSMSTLDIISSIGRGMQITALLLRLLWHVTVVRTILAVQVTDGLAAKRTRHYLPTVGAEEVLPGLPITFESLSRISVILAAGSVWWNPFFTQTVRGFTRHVVGMSTWYTYQAMIVFLLAVAPPLLNGSIVVKRQATPLLAGHVFLAVFTGFIYLLANRTIRIDTSPLFSHRATQDSTLAQAPGVQPHATETSLAYMLEEVSHDRATDSAYSEAALLPRSGQDQSSRADEAVLSSRLMDAQYAAPPNMGQLSLSEQGSAVSRIGSQMRREDDEMDWAPTQSPFRAFNSYRPDLAQNGGFGQAPVEPRNGPIWFKVPPAPTSPAERRFKPVSAPMRRSPLAKEDFKFRAVPLSESNRNGGGSRKDDQDIAFAPSKLFAESTNKDRRVSTLASMFDQSLALDTDQHEASKARDANARRTSEAIASRFRGWESALLLLLSAGLAHAFLRPHRFGVQVMIGSGLCCLFLSILSASNDIYRFRQRRKADWRTVNDALFGVLEIGAAGIIGFRSWNGVSSNLIETQGGWLVALMITHQFCNLIFWR
jgi:hypothetical protein